MTVKYVKFVDGKGGVVNDFNTEIIPRIGEHVHFTHGDQYKVTDVMSVYGRTGDWVMVTVEPRQ